MAADVACAVCLISRDLVAMPCCPTEGSSTQFCFRCIELICQHGGGTGKCPKCRKHIVIKNGAVALNTEQMRCIMCRQMRIITENRMCDACNVGCRRPLLYECERCHRRQRIPHPMYRYQPSPQEYCNSSWACHQGCGDYTRWRVVPEDVQHVPPQDAPESWGLLESQLVRVREQRQREEEQGTRPEGRPEGRPGGCVLS
uniref:RING-type domain-containing protein n=1 Tax=Alexandrium monilatum TaxID=311494 RepID=A0A7S4RWF0_9DINO